MMGLTVILIWKPAYFGMKDNKTADGCAKEATQKDNINITVQ